MAQDVPSRPLIAAGTRLAPVPLVPEIRLHLAGDPISLWQRTEEDSGRTGLDPPFWAFAWAAGQALARYLLDHADIVRSRDVIDIASGSGLVAIAAALAGAAEVTANDVDPYAVAAASAPRRTPGGPAWTRRSGRSLGLPGRPWPVTCSTTRRSRWTAR